MLESMKNKVELINDTNIKLLLMPFFKSNLNKAQIVIFIIPTEKGIIIESINCNFARAVSNIVFIIVVDFEIEARIPNIAPRKPVIIDEKFNTSPIKSSITSLESTFDKHILISNIKTAPKR